MSVPRADPAEGGQVGSTNAAGTATAATSTPLVGRPRLLGPVVGLWLPVAALLVVVVLAAASGAVAIPADRLLPVLLGREQGPDAVLWRNVLVDVRLPRIALGLLVGASLAAAGTAMQAMFRNPLAEPGLVGVTLGGATGAVLAIVAGAGEIGVMGAAVLGSMLATSAAYLLGRDRAGATGVLLAGIAINAICASLIGLCSYVADDVQLRNLTFWNLGSLAGADWMTLMWVAPWVAGLLWLLARHWRALNALLLGEREAAHLGYGGRALRRRLIVLTALLIGPLVAITGSIAFVGLVVPHLVRLVVGADHRLLLPRVIVAGALALTLCDWAARMVVIPAELPIGIVTSLIGGPFLLVLMRRAGAGR